MDTTVTTVSHKGMITAEEEDSGAGALTFPLPFGLQGIICLYECVY